MTAYILEARSASKTYHRRTGLWRRDAGPVRAVDSVNFALAKGERVGLVGESGCGKTTLAKLLIGLLSPTSGDILLAGVPRTSLRGSALRHARRKAQLIFQDPTNSLNPLMNVEETLSEPLRIHGLAAGTALRQRVLELLKDVQLPADYGRRLPRELSGGERQRVGIARALAINPDILICDEPIASLDLSIGVQILVLLRRLCDERRMALLFISHDLRAVASLCERLVVMRQGLIVDEGPTKPLLAQPAHPYTTLLLHSARLDLDAPPM